MEGWVCKVLEVFLQVLQVPHQQGDLSPWKACSSYSIRWRHARTIPSFSFLYFTLLPVSLKFLLSVLSNDKVTSFRVFVRQSWVFLFYTLLISCVCVISESTFACQALFTFSNYICKKLLFCMPFEFMCYLRWLQKIRAFLHWHMLSLKVYFWFFLCCQSALLSKKSVLS